MQYSHTREQKLSNSDRSRPAGNSANLGKAEDIPAALRDGRKTQGVRNKYPQRSIGKIAVGLSIVLAGGAALALATAKQAPNPIASTSNITDSPTQQPPQAGNQTVSNNQSTDNVLNHLPYTEAQPSELVSIGGGYQLRKAAASKFQSMIADARSNGVNITTISAFRSVEAQKRLFFGVGAERGQQPTKRAEVSAPPKYSEHHTGYAIDVGDGSVSATNLNQNFDTTPAYKWLKANAARYSFELSFPKGNIQKVSYEPWHWRFVGDINSLETFYKAHNLQNK
jgi:zinc D-Ala-D-Ala carboxypeptidase